jgi:hypothetical protein
VLASQVIKGMVNSVRMKTNVKRIHITVGSILNVKITLVVTLALAYLDMKKKVELVQRFCIAQVTLAMLWLPVPRATLKPFVPANLVMVVMEGLVIDWSVLSTIDQGAAQQPLY